EVCREAREDPLLVEQRALVRPPVDAHEVTRPRIHRQPRLRREVAVVALDQHVHLREAPPACGLAPETLELGRVDAALRELAPRGLELALVQVELLLDRAQPAHPDRRPAERADRGVGVGAEVPQPLLERRARLRNRRQLLLEDASLLAVPRRLRTNRA